MKTKAHQANWASILRQAPRPDTAGAFRAIVESLSARTRQVNSRFTAKYTRPAKIHSFFEYTGRLSSRSRVRGYQSGTTTRAISDTCAAARNCIWIRNAGSDLRGPRIMLLTKTIYLAEAHGREPAAAGSGRIAIMQFRAAAHVSEIARVVVPDWYPRTLDRPGKASRIFEKAMNFRGTGVFRRETRIHLPRTSG